MIPKIVHYCWFGHASKNYMANRCVKSFNKMGGGKLKIIEWNEDNCDFNENSYIREAYDNRLWAFVSDYFRLKALFEYGGIYFDTDVEVKKPFPTEFFKADLVLGYMYECAISTAVIMARPRHPYIKGLLDLYKTMPLSKTVPNNVIFNDYTFDYYPDFLLNGKFREFAPRCFIYPRHYFEVPTFGKDGGYSVHHFMGSWHGANSSVKALLRGCFKWCRFYCPVLDWWYQNYFRNKLLRKSGYYKKYLIDKTKEQR